jgi:hypothetical protein
MIGAVQEDRYTVSGTISDSENTRGLRVMADVIEADHNGSLAVMLYVPYWIFDLTDLNLIWSENKERMVLQQDTPLPSLTIDELKAMKLDEKKLSKLAMFNFSAERMDGIFLRAASSATSSWSNKFGIDVITPIASVTVPDLGEKGSLTNDKQRFYELGVNISEAPGLFNRTKVTHTFSMPLLLMRPLA